MRDAVKEGGRFFDGIVGEEHLVQDVRLHTLLKRIQIHAAVEGEDAAHAVEREPHAQVDRRRESHPDHQDERERVGREHDDRRDAELQHLELNDPAELDPLDVLSTHLVGALHALDEATAGDGTRLDAEPDRIGPSRRDRQIGEHRVMVHDAVHVDHESGADHLHADRVAHLRRDRGRQLEPGELPRRVAEDAEGHLAQLDSGEGEPHRQHRAFVAAAVAEIEALSGVERDRGDRLRLGRCGPGHELGEQFVFGEPGLELCAQTDADYRIGRDVELSVALDQR